MAMDYRLALDLGTNSLGWAMLRLGHGETNKPVPKAIIRSGVRIFGDGRDPKSGSSLAVNRRLARGMRRNRDRTLSRKQRLLDALVSSGFLPTDIVDRRELTTLDPYQLRARGLTQELTPHEFGRALFHLAQRRGFKSNRKTDNADSDGSLMKGTIERLRLALVADGYQTIGQWLAERHDERKSVRARLHGSTVKDKTYDLYFDRAMIEDEFNALWEAQASFNPSFFSESKRKLIHEAVFFQRDLLPVRPGRCTLEPTLDRAAKALPSSQLFRIYQEVNNLGIEDGNFAYRPLTLFERDAITVKLLNQKSMSFDAMRRTLKIGGSTRFNLEDEKRKELKGNLTGAILGHPELMGEVWGNLSVQEQDQIVIQVLDIEDERELIVWLTETFSISEDAALATSKARGSLEKAAAGYSNLSVTAIYKILPHLQGSVLRYSDAVLAAGYASHSALSHMEQTGEILNELPYYGEYLTRHVGHGTGETEDADALRFGRIANPTVHIALNELRKVVNDLIKHYGPPSEITVEIARELKRTLEQKREDSKQQAENQRFNERLTQEIYELTGITAKRPDLQKMKLWVELNKSDPTNRRCIYTGEVISIQRLFSSEVEIEHVLPFSRTLDDSMNNKTVSFVRANRDKGNRTPFEAFGESPEGYDYEGILERARLTNMRRAYRFGPEGYAKWLKDDADFLARALTDTQYLSRIAKEYLQLICPEPVTVVPGRMTASLRRHWGLNHLLSEDGEKNRLDHRHHAVDAIVLGLMDRGSLQRYAKNQGRGIDITQQLEKKPHEEPLPELRAKAQVAVDSIVVSHRPNHSYERQMNNDTNYGLRANGKVTSRQLLADFETLESISKADFADPSLKQRILRFVGDATPEQLKMRLQEFSDTQGVRKVRTLSNLDVIPIPINEKALYRAPKRGKAREDNAIRGVKGDSNYCIEISADEKGKWGSEVVTTFEAYRIVREEGKDRLRDPRLTQSGAPLVVRLMRDDIVELQIDDEGKRQLMRLCKFDSSGRMNFAPVNEANVDARVREKSLNYLSASAATMQKRNPKSVSVSPSGRVSKRKIM